MGLIERLMPWIRSPESPEVSFAKTVERAGLQQCTREVVIACPEYGDEHYRCEIRVATPVLYQWAKKRADPARLDGLNPRNAEEWLAVWLSQADLTDRRASKVAGEMYRNFRDYIPEFVMNGQARVYSFLCQGWVSDVKEVELDRDRDGVWHVWTTRWSCPLGHQLYQETHRMHLQYRRD